MRVGDEHASDFLPVGEALPHFRRRESGAEEVDAGILAARRSDGAVGALLHPLLARLWLAAVLQLSSSLKHVGIEAIALRRRAADDDDV